MTLEERVNALGQTLSTQGWQDVIEPAIIKALALADEQLMTGRRPEGAERVTDDMLKGRILALRWLLDWKKNHKVLYEQFEAQERVRIALNT